MPLDVRIVTLRITGSEPRLLATTVRAALPDVRSCFEKAAPKSGRWVDVTLAVDAAGAPSGVKTKGDLAADIGACVEAVFAGKTFEPKAGRVATLEIGIRFTTVDETSRPSLTKNDTLFRSPDGSCLALEVFNCPPNKSCAAPRERPIACPTELGLADIAKPGDADKRIDLAMSGGKSGEAGERVVLSRVGDRCSLYKVVGIGEGGEDAATKELVDVPCADFERIFPLAEQRFAGAKPANPKSPKGVTRTVAFWRMGKDSVPIVSEVRWTGENKKLDASFGELVAIVSKAAKGRGALALRRFVE
ncbi:MAG: hypothetical protein JNK04_17410 [Myxococcales bacterium]|nr:hypothetical protein [Myxococcales bacterium]